MTLYRYSMTGIALTVCGIVLVACSATNPGASPEVTIPPTSTSQLSSLSMPIKTSVATPSPTSSPAANSATVAPSASPTAAAPTPAPTPAPAPAPAPAPVPAPTGPLFDQVRYVVAAANVRAAPGGDRIGGLAAGSQVTAARPAGEWTPIQYNAGIGYVHTSLLSDQPPAAAPAPVPGRPKPRPAQPGPAKPGPAPVPAPGPDPQPAPAPVPPAPVPPAPAPAKPAMKCGPSCIVAAMNGYRSNPLTLVKSSAGYAATISCGAYGANAVSGWVDTSSQFAARCAKSPDHAALMKADRFTKVAVVVSQSGAIMAYLIP